MRRRLRVDGPSVSKDSRTLVRVNIRVYLNAIVFEHDRLYVCLSARVVIAYVRQRRAVTQSDANRMQTASK